jgi:hypothetical protein
MKLLLIVPLIVLTAFVLPAAISGDFRQPDEAIIGSWKEVSWKYEIVDAHAANRDSTLVEPNPSLEHDVFSELIIHRSEEWHFGKNGGLVLEKKGSRKPVKVTWSLKGRGHILKLSYADSTTEFYQVRELTDKRMVLHFENDVHARGIVKIIFTRT